jgi:GAF domain-containing protein
MSMPEDQNSLQAAAAAGLLASEDAHRALLESIVEVARAIFRARSASIFLYDDDADELVFEAVTEAESQDLVGRRFPSSRGVAGWVLVTRQPLILDDVNKDPRFARDIAEDTGYTPTSLMAVPLLVGEAPVGVLEVLDRTAERRSGTADMELLGLFGVQAAIALDLLRRARRAATAARGGDPGASGALGLVAAVDELEGKRRDAALHLIKSLEELLRTT